MKYFIFLPLFFVSVFVLVGCSNSEYMQCTEDASGLWNTKEDQSDKQSAYWRAIERCKEEYQ